MTSHELAHACFLSVAMVLVHAHYAHMCAFAIAITRGLRHNTKVCEPIRGCDCEFRDVLDMCSGEVTSDFHSVFQINSHLESSPNLSLMCFITILLSKATGN